MSCAERRPRLATISSSRSSRRRGPALSPFGVCVGLATFTLVLVASGCNALDDEQKAKAEQKLADAEQKLAQAQEKLDAAAKKAKAKIDEKRPEVEKKLGELQSGTKDRVERAKANLDEATSYRPIEGAEEAIGCEASVCTVDKAFAAQFSKHPEWLAREVKIAPAFRGGRIYGLRVAYVHEGSLVDLLGLRAGDVVTTVDGTPITSVAEVQKLAEKDRSTVRDIEVVYERAGQTQTLTLRQARP